MFNAPATEPRFESPSSPNHVATQSSPREGSYLLSQSPISTTLSNQTPTTRTSLVIPPGEMFSRSARKKVNYAEVSDAEDDLEEPISSDHHEEIADLDHRRSTRKRTAPKRFPPEQTKSAKATSHCTKEGSRRSTRRDTGRKPRTTEAQKWSEEYLMTNQNSKLATGNLFSILNTELWDQLPEEDKLEALKHVPEKDKVYDQDDPSKISEDTQPKALLPATFWKTDSLKEAIHSFQKNLIEGRYDPLYLSRAAKARDLRQSGACDSFKDEQFEMFWGQKQRLRGGVIAGEASNVKVQTLAKHQYLKVGDVWSYRRSFKGVAHTIEKDATLIAIDPETYSFTFSYPPGHYQYTSAERPDKTVENVISMGALEALILKEDGRGPEKPPNGNAFKAFRIKRADQDIGSLFEVRADFYSKYLAADLDE